MNDDLTYYHIENLDNIIKSLGSPSLSNSLTDDYCYFYVKNEGFKSVCFNSRYYQRDKSNERDLSFSISMYDPSTINVEIVNRKLNTGIRLSHNSYEILSISNYVNNETSGYEVIIKNVKVLDTETLFNLNLTCPYVTELFKIMNCALDNIDKFKKDLYDV